MPRLRRYLPPLVILLPLILICGKVLITPIDAHIMVGSGFMRGPRYQDFPERGWPWLYQQAGLHDDFDALIWPTCETSNYGYDSTTGESAFSFWQLLADVAILLIPIVAAAVLLVWWRRRSGGWLRFSVRGLLVWVAVIAIACGWWANHARQYRQEQAILKAWDDEVLMSRDDYDGPHWLRRLAPDPVLKVFHHVAFVDLTIKLEDDKLETALPDAFLAALPHLPHLRALNVMNDYRRHDDEPAPVIRFDRETIRQIARIKFVELSWRAADDESLGQIAQLPDLRALKIYDCPITDNGLAALRASHTLQMISLTSCKQLTNAGIDALLEQPGLTRLDIMHCEKLTSKAVRREQEFPGLTVLHDLFEPEDLESSK